MHGIPSTTDRPKTSSPAHRGRLVALLLGALTLLAVVVAAALPSAAQAPNSAPASSQAQPGAQAIQPLGQPAAPQGLVAQPTGQAAQPADPNQAAPSQAQQDKEWLTAYFLVHQGYKFQHMPAIDATLNKMTPTQLHTLREMYDQKHSMMMQQQATFNQWNARKLAQAQAWDQRQQRQMNQISSEESQSANVEEQQINQMHQEAAANAEMKNQSYPGYYGPYGGAYGGGYVHPWFNPLGGY